MSKRAAPFVLPMPAGAWWNRIGNAKPIKGEKQARALYRELARVTGNRPDAMSRCIGSSKRKGSRGCLWMWPFTIGVAPLLTIEAMVADLRKDQLVTSGFDQAHRQGPKWRCDPHGNLRRALWLRLLPGRAFRFSIPGPSQKKASCNGGASLACGRIGHGGHWPWRCNLAPAL